MGHQMRSPFEFSYPCEPVSFDIDIVPPALPFCSVPVFTTPTVRITSLAFSAPVVIAPWNCHTIPTFFANVSATPTRDVSRFHVSMRVTPTSLDACDPEFSLSLLADIPCLPLSVAASAVVSMLPMGENVDEQWMPADPEVVADAFMKEHCDMQIDTAFRLPCIPFTPKVSSAIFVGSTPSKVPVSHDIKFAVDGCELKLVVDINLPEYPTPDGRGVTGVNVVKSTVNVDYDVYADLALSACVDNDVIQLGVSLNLPCIPFTQELRGTPGTFYADACNLILSLPAFPTPVLNGVAGDFHVDTDTNELILSLPAYSTPDAAASFDVMFDFDYAVVVSNKLEIVFKTKNVRTGADGTNVTAFIHVARFND